MLVMVTTVILVMITLMMVMMILVMEMTTMCFHFQAAAPLKP